MTAATSPGAVGGEGRRARVTRFLRRPARTTRQQLDDALAAIGGGALLVAALRITDLINPHVLQSIWR